MKKTIQAASVIALSVAASSALAWYGNPYPVGCMTDQQKLALADQQKAFVERQQAMAAQYAKAAEQSMAAQRQAAEQAMATQRQAARFAELQKQAPQGVPAPAAPNWDLPASAGWPQGPQFAQPAMPGFPAAPDFARREPPSPQMPDFKIPDFPAAPEFAGDQIKELDAYRAQARQNMAARRAAMKAYNDRRALPHPRYGFGPRPAGFGPGMGAGGVCPPAAAQPQATAPAAGQPTTVATAPAKQ